MPSALSKDPVVSDPEAEERKKRQVRAIRASAFLSVMQSLITIQSEPLLVRDACGGDTGRAALLLGNTTGLVGLLGMVFNQVGGRVSDSIGRKPCFLLGPICNFILGLTVYKNSSNVSLLLVARALRSIFTTFSSTVTIQAALQDVVSGKSLALEGSKVGSLAGLAVILGPFLESHILGRAGNSFKHPYIALTALAGIQFAYTSSALPETLADKAKKPLRLTASNFNPFGFMKIFAHENWVLKRIALITTMQMVLEGKAVSDMVQIWMRNHLGWETAGVRNFLVSYGLATYLAGAKVTPYLLKRSSTLGFTTLTNMTNALGFIMRGLAESGPLYVLAVIPMLPGVNGSSATALSALRTRHAIAAGFSIGEFSAWVNNLRLLANSFASWGYAQWYAYCRKRNMYPGTVFFLCALVGAILPELLLRPLYGMNIEPPALPGTGAPKKSGAK
eukprot:TRINITY_DN68454_c0_g1_i1.p1 TRINITY_DN68454_c0_g1~~TRINITY_DN68454_c0_g1_i1.p1  ORF type:complete len:448 (-),score=50.10 TRINITY_DN68454_c0_g1_i1:23-1366(-)